MSQELTLFTIGHSTHSLDEFLALLANHRIEVLADIRRFPTSRKFPHFNREALSSSLRQAGVEYHWMEVLGGRRQKIRGDETSPNLGLENESFRNYADYMLKKEFQEGATKLVEIAGRKRTAIMCAKAVYWRCHRRLVSDFLTANGIAVQHIMPTGELRPHELTRGAVAEKGRVTYPGEKSLFP